MNEQQIAYDQSVATSTDSKSCFLAALAYFGMPDSFNDIGCGDGHLVELAASMGIFSYGVDLNCFSRNNARMFIQQSEIVDADIPKYELTFCLELAEHLPKDQADVLCTILADSTNKTLVFSAATPGQGGSGHLNEQPLEYWRHKLEARGFEYLHGTTEDLMEMWRKVAENAWWYSQNVQVFEKR